MVRWGLLFAILPVAYSQAIESFDIFLPMEFIPRLCFVRPPTNSSIDGNARGFPAKTVINASSQGAKDLYECQVVGKEQTGVWNKIKSAEKVIELDYPQKARPEHAVDPRFCRMSVSNSSERVDIPSDMVFASAQGKAYKCSSEGKVEQATASEFEELACQAVKLRKKQYEAAEQLARLRNYNEEDYKMLGELLRSLEQANETIGGFYRKHIPHLACMGQPSSVNPLDDLNLEPFRSFYLDMANELKPSGLFKLLQRLPGNRGTL